jgi:hypothetical protein
MPLPSRSLLLQVPVNEVPTLLSDEQIDFGQRASCAPAGAAAPVPPAAGQSGGQLLLAGRGQHDRHTHKPHHRPLCLCCAAAPLDYNHGQHHHAAPAPLYGSNASALPSRQGAPPLPGCPTPPLPPRAAAPLAEPGLAPPQRKLRALACKSAAVLVAWPPLSALHAWPGAPARRQHQQHRQRLGRFRASSRFRPSAAGLRPCPERCCPPSPPPPPLCRAEPPAAKARGSGGQGRRHAAVGGGQGGGAGGLAAAASAADADADAAAGGN